MKMVGWTQGSHNICRVKDNGGSKRRQDESPGESTETYISRWIAANAVFRKEAQFR